MTLTELTSSKRISLLHSFGYMTVIGSNSPIAVHQYKVKFEKKDGTTILIGEGKARTRSKARADALNDALNWVNE